MSVGSVVWTIIDRSTTAESYLYEQIMSLICKGEAWRSGISLSGNTTLTASDPVTETTTSAETAENKNWHVSTMKTYNDANAAVVLRTTKTSADGRTTKQIEFGRTTTTTRTYYNTIDEKGMSVTTTAPDGTTVTESYNADGLLESSTHSVLGDTTYTYDGLNRVATQSHFENGVEHATSYTYDKRSQVKTVTERCGSAVRSTSYEYDSMGRRTKETKPGNRVVTYTYDLTGAMVATSGAETYPQSYTYEFGRMKTLTTYRNNPALPETTTWNYDVFGRLSSKKYANNSQVSYSYNANNQLSTRSWARGRTTSYTYDGAGRLKTVTYDGSDTPKITYTYNRLGQLTQVVDAAGTRTLTYNADGTPATETVPNVAGHTVSHTYDTLGREAALKLMNGATALYEAGYTYDNMSRLATATFANQSATYSRVSGSNRLNTSVFKNGTTAIHTATRSYDNFKLKTIYNATTKLEFAYDYMGRRFSKKVYTKSGTSWVLSNENAFAYNGYKQIAEYTVSGTTKTLSKSTVWQPAASGDLDVVLWYRDGNTVYTLLPDGNKNTRQLKNTAGTIVATYDYDPFGNVIATTGTVLNPWKFSSEYHDSETGLVYYNYRDYAPSLGRWISRDPIGENGGINLYRVARNNCLSKLDLNGLFEFKGAMSQKGDWQKTSIEGWNGPEKSVQEFATYYASVVAKIIFSPNPDNTDCGCESIEMIQVCRLKDKDGNIYNFENTDDIRNKYRTPTGFFVDANTEKSPFYRTSQSIVGSTFETGWIFSSVTDARIYDEPTTQSYKAYLSFEFETCAVCTDSKRNKNKYFSCITWSFIINEIYIESLTKTLSPKNPSKDFINALKKFPEENYE